MGIAREKAKQNKKGAEAYGKDVVGNQRE